MNGVICDRRQGCDEFIVETLVVPLGVMVDYVFGYRCPKVSLTEGYDAVETLSAYGEHESFRICVQIWTLGWKAEGLHACISQEPTYLLGEQRVPIVDEVSLAKEEPIPHIGEVPRHLLHPITVWIGGDTTNAYATSSDIDDKHDMVADEPEGAQNLHREQIRGSDSPPMCFDEGAPRHALTPLWCWHDTVVCEASFAGMAPDVISEVLECAPQPCVPPCRVLLRHAHEELTNVLRRRWSARATVLAAIVLGRNEVAIPAQKRIGSDDGGDLGQRFSTQSLGLDGEPAALNVREPESFAAKLGSEHTVLLLEVVDHGLLIAVDPASQAKQ